MGRGVGGRGCGWVMVVVLLRLWRTRTCNRRVERVEVEEQHEHRRSPLRLGRATRMGLLTARLAIAAAVRRVVVIVAAGIAAAASLLLVVSCSSALGVLLLLLRHPHLVGRGGGDEEVG